MEQKLEFKISIARTELYAHRQYLLGKKKLKYLYFNSPV